MHEAKTQLSRLVQALRDGQEREIIIAVSGKPCARLVPYVTRKRPSGMDAGRIVIADDFDAPDAEFERLFYDGPSFPERASLKLLLDTHIFLWFTSRPKDLGKAAFAAIEDPANDVFISAIVAWEIVTKHAKGKLTLPLQPALYPSTRLKELGFRAPPITQEHALGAAGLPAVHADPFDRMMVAQAQVEGLTFVTRDARALAYLVETLPGW